MNLRFIVSLQIIFQLCYGRIPQDQRKFISRQVEIAIDEISLKIIDPDLQKLFQNAFPNTLDTTVKYFNVSYGKPDTYIITGDIDAMWLRDSTNQVLSYKQFFSKDSDLAQMVKGVINRQIQYVLLDPYANAFNFDKEGSEWQSDWSTRQVFGIKAWVMIDQLHERKFEIDSITSVIRLQNEYYKQTGDWSIFDFNYFKCLSKIIKVFKVMQNDHQQETKQSRVSYGFSRLSNEPSETQSHQRGLPTKYNGLIRTFFRPSDDATLFQFNIPLNAYASSMLNEAGQILKQLTTNPKVSYTIQLLSEQYSTISINFSNEIKKAIYLYGLSPTRDYFLYEVDGFGNGYFMDDANLPSLLGLPLFGFIDINDQLYQNTRNRVLSDKNPYYFSGKLSSGIGGPHVGLDYIWPMSLITQAMTSTNQNEIQECISTLTRTTADTYFIHESFHKDNQYDYTRSWFAWANGLFGELIYNFYKNKQIVQ